jgi:hypothetical protein
MSLRGSHRSVEHRRLSDCKPVTGTRGKFGAEMSLGAADTSGERSRVGTSLAPATTAQGGKQVKFPVNLSKSITWSVVSSMWLLESVRATSKLRASSAALLQSIDRKEAGAAVEFCGVLHQASSSTANCAAACQVPRCGGAFPGGRRSKLSRRDCRITRTRYTPIRRP